MNPKVKFPRADAVAVAREIVGPMIPLCERLIVAGSLRRMKAEVGDIEIVYIPARGTRPDPGDLFGRPIECNLVDDMLADWLPAGILRKRPKSDGTFTWGEEIKLAVHVASGIPVDFFSARLSNWACVLVCRTGSAESNQRICQAAIARGWKWQPYGLGFEDRATGELVRRCKTEREVFEAVGLPYLEPRYRT